MRVKNKKGFTLVELLTVIIILGILSVVVLASFGVFMENARQRYYQSQSNMVVLAGKNYFNDYRSKLPKDIAATSEVKLSTLIEQKYIDEVLDINGEVCQYAESSVKVVKVTNKKYRYFASLRCENQERGDKLDTVNPAITLTRTPTKTPVNQDVEVTFTGYNDASKKSSDLIIGYTYKIEKIGTTTEVIKNIDSPLEYKGTVKLPKFKEDGVYRVTATIYKLSLTGLKATANTGKFEIDKTPPNCVDEVIIKSSAPINQWVSAVTLEIDASASSIDTWDYGEVVNNQFKLLNTYSRGKQTKTLGNGTHTVRVVAKDKAGNFCQKDAGPYKVENTNFTVSVTGSVANKTWTNKAVTLTASVSPSSVPSGYSYQWQVLNGSTWTDIAGATKLTYTVDTTTSLQQAYRMKVTSGSGIVKYSDSNDRYWVYISKVLDITSQVYLRNSDGSCGSYVRQATNGTVSAGWTDAASGLYFKFAINAPSGVKRSEWRWNQEYTNETNSNNWPSDHLKTYNYAMPDTYMQKEGYRRAKLTVYDNAGNHRTVEVIAKMDRTDPVPKITIDASRKSTSGRNWYKAPVDITVSCTDSYSGVKRHRLKVNGEDEGSIDAASRVRTIKKAWQPLKIAVGCVDNAGNVDWGSKSYYVRVKTESASKCGTICKNNANTCTGGWVTGAWGQCTSYQVGTGCTAYETSTKRVTCSGNGLLQTMTVCYRDNYYDDCISGSPNTCVQSGASSCWHY